MLSYSSIFEALDLYFATKYLPSQVNIWVSLELPLKTDYLKKFIDTFYTSNDRKNGDTSSSIYINIILTRLEGVGTF